MEQKLINERIAMAMLKVCAIMWEYLTRNPNKGEFSLLELRDNLGSKKDDKSRTGCIGYNDIYGNDMVIGKLREIDGVRWDDKDWKVIITIPTDNFNKFTCDFMIQTAWWLTVKFCRKNGCQKLMREAVFGNDSNGHWSRLPELKPVKPRKARVVKKPSKRETAIEKLRAAAARLHKAA